MTLEQSQQTDLPQMELQLTQSVEDFPAKTSAAQEKAQVLKANVAACGLNTPELLASYDHDTSSWRTSQHCLVEGLTVFSERWPRSGMMQNGIAYQLQPLVRLTDETEYGLWPTPTTDGFAAEGQVKGIIRMTQNLDMAIQMTGRQKRTKKLWRTPNSGLAKLSYTENCGKYYEKRIARKNGQIDLAMQIYQSEGNGRLNPAWVEWLMGFPLGHTDLEL